MDFHRNGLLVIWLHLFFNCLGQALKNCRSKSSNCIPARSLSISFICQEKGHFPTHTDSSSYFKCPGKDFLPCRCSCRSSQQCFDPLRRRCRFSFLDSVKNCTGKSSNRQNADTDLKFSKFSGTSNLGSNKMNVQKVKSGLNEILKPTLPSPEAAGELSNQITLDYSQNSLLPLEETMAAQQQSAKKGPPKVIEDNSKFPAWAISLLVLCIVLVLVFIVMVMY